MNLKPFKYSNTQHKHHGSQKTTHKVHIKNGKGYKSLTHFKGGKRMYHSKKHLSFGEVTMIRKGKFIPGLFNDLKHKTRRRHV